MAAGEIHDLTYLGFSDFMAEHANHGDAFLMNGQHDFKRLRMGHAKKPFQNVNDELHRRIVVVQQQHFVKWWALRPRAGLDRDTAVIVIVVAVIGRHHMHFGKRLGHQGHTWFAR